MYYPEELEHADYTEENWYRDFFIAILGLVVVAFIVF